MSEIEQFRPLPHKLKGWFLEFRLIPVLLWSYTSVVLGTALAWWERGTFDLGFLLVAMALAGLVQGWVTHSINDIYDWRSGTDGDGHPRALSGGSKVRNLSLLSERDLWAIFAVSTLAVLLLAAYAAMTRPLWLVLLVAAGYASGVAYTLPPPATAYRPFLGEWLGGFPGVLLAGLGAYGMQAGALSWTAVVALTAHALVCAAMLVMHHYQDAPADAQAHPPKRTTVVALGPIGSRRYAASLAGAAALLYGLLGVLVTPALLLGVAFTIPAVLVHGWTNLGSLASITKSELRVIQLGIGAGLAPSVLLAPILWPLVPVAVLGYEVHLWVVAPPAELARAWLPVRRPRAEDANSAGPLSRT